MPESTTKERPMPTTIADLQQSAHLNSVGKGFWDDQKDLSGNHLEPDLVEAEIPLKLALIHSEVSEALEEYRNSHPPAEVRIENGKPEGFPVELADTVIRIFDLCGALGVDLDAAIELKMAFNATRPHRHGGKRA
jgi:NTP pyrophosphatase (non-canonical NTP hydrolase)